MKTVEIKSVKESDIAEIHKLLYISFEEYNKDSYPTLMYFRTVMKRTGVELDLSYAAFVDGKLVGVMLNAIDYVYAFDFITAVHPDYRGMKIAVKLYEVSTDNLKKHKILVYRSEIFKKNTKAFLLYQGLGMRKIRELWTFRGDVSHLQNKSSSAHKKCFIDFKRQLPTDIDHLPSWENSMRIISRNKELFDLYYVNYPFTPKIVAYAVVQKDNGTIRIFHAEQTILRKFFAKSLMIKIARDHKFVKAVDIDRDWNWLINFYESLNFVESNEVNEMEVVLNTRAEIHE